jgi:hypothetical protein
VATCEIQDCPDPVKAHGWCRAHYGRWQRHGDPLAGRRRPEPGRTCTADGCNEPIRRNALCNLHSQRLRIKGDPFADQPRQVRLRRSNEGLLCSEADCGEQVVARDLCRTHYLRWWRTGNPRRVRVPKSQRPELFVERFWSHVDKQGPAPAHLPELGSCSEWIAAVNKEDGYGVLTNGDGGIQYAHRYSWELHYGPIPDGLWVLHHCDNTICVRPDHLFLGTAADNVADMLTKGRARWQRTKPIAD